jgi:hypothetical protein
VLIVIDSALGLAFRILVGLELTNKNRGGRQRH